MPINTLANGLPTLNVLAKIRKGYPKENGRLGRDLNDRLRIQFIQPAKVDEVMLFRSMFDCTEISVPDSNRIDLITNKITFFAPFTDPSKIWDANIEGFSAGGLIARGNGETWEYLRAHPSIHGHSELLVQHGKTVLEHKDSNGTIYQPGEIRPILPDEPIALNRKDNRIYPKVRAKMNIMIPGFRMNHFQIISTAWADIYRLKSQWDALKETAEAFGGTIAGALLDLTRVETEIQKIINGVPRQMPHHCLNISVNPEWADAKMPALAPSALSFLENIEPAPQIEAEAEAPVEAVSVELLPREETVETIEADIFEEESPIGKEFTVPEWVNFPENITVHADPVSLFWAIVRYQEFHGERMTQEAAQEILNNTSSFEEAIEFIGTMLDESGEAA